jgi:hypothetical protein
LLLTQSIARSQAEPFTPEELLRDVRTYSREPIGIEDRYRQHRFAERLSRAPVTMGRALMRLYRDEETSQNDRRRILRWLIETRYRGARSVALDALEQFADDPAALADALRILSWAGQPADTQRVYDLLLATDSSNVIDEALHTLAWIRNPGSISNLQGYAIQKSNPKANEAARFIEMHRAENRIEQLVRAMPDNRYAREWVEKNLRLAAPVLVEQLDNDDLRPSAARLLGELRDPMTLPALKRAAADPDGTPRLSVLTAIAAFGPIHLADRPEVVTERIRALTTLDAKDPALRRTVYDLTALTHREFGALGAVQRLARGEGKPAKKALWKAAVAFDQWWREYRQNPPSRQYHNMILRMRFMLPTARLSGDRRETARFAYRDFLRRQPGEANRLLRAIAQRPTEDPTYLQAAMKAVLNGGE